MTAARVIFCRANTASSVGLRAVQRPLLAPWSHAAPVLPGGRVIEAMAARGRVVETPLLDVVARSSVVEVLQLSVPLPDAWVREVEGQAGLPYGYLDALGAWLGTRRLDTHGLYCSEAAAAALVLAGRDILAPGTRGVMPWALYRLMWAAGARPILLDEAAR